MRRGHPTAEAGSIQQEPPTCRGGGAAPQGARLGLVAHVARLGLVAHVSYVGGSRHELWLLRRPTARRFQEVAAVSRRHLSEEQCYLSVAAGVVPPTSFHVRIYL